MQTTTQELVFKLSIQDVDAMVRVLTKAPWEVVNPILKKIEDQANSQPAVLASLAPPAAPPGPASAAGSVAESAPGIPGPL